MVEGEGRYKTYLAGNCRPPGSAQPSFHSNTLPLNITAYRCAWGYREDSGLATPSPFIPRALYPDGPWQGLCPHPALGGCCWALPFLGPFFTFFES